MAVFNKTVRGTKEKLNSVYINHINIKQIELKIQSDTHTDLLCCSLQMFCSGFIGGMNIRKAKMFFDCFPASIYICIEKVRYHFLSHQRAAELRGF